jgi:corrinoid protein of di/trimethylamine methyltransferase
MPDLTKLHDAILNGDAKTALAITKEAVSEKIDPVTLVTNYMVPAMDEVGRRFECEEYFVPELLLAARAMKGSLAVLRPLLAAQGAKPVAIVVIGTVKGDLHDIGKNLVSAMLEGGGFEIIDLGSDVAPEKFVEAVKEKGAQIVALSALLTVTMPSMKTTIEALKTAGLRSQVKVMVGGAPVTNQYAQEIGADGYGESASSAVHVARKLAGVN